MSTPPREPPPASSLDLSALEARYAAGKETPSDIVEDVLGRIARARGDRVWISVAPREDLLVAARALEQRRARGEPLPLYGVPFAVKDNIDVAGLPTTAA